MAATDRSTCIGIRTHHFLISSGSSADQNASDFRVLGIGVQNLGFRTSCLEIRHEGLAFRG